MREVLLIGLLWSRSGTNKLISRSRDVVIYLMKSDGASCQHPPLHWDKSRSFSLIKSQNICYAFHSLFREDAHRGFYRNKAIFAKTRAAVNPHAESGRGNDTQTEAGWYHFRFTSRAWGCHCSSVGRWVRRCWLACHIHLMGCLGNRGAQRPVCTLPVSSGPPEVTDVGRVLAEQLQLLQSGCRATSTPRTRLSEGKACLFSSPPLFFRPAAELSVKWRIEQKAGQLSYIQGSSHPRKKTCDSITFFFWVAMRKQSPLLP